MVRSEGAGVALAEPVWGVLGGMGPAASAAFIQTIYDACETAEEHLKPVMLLASDPTLPDRTAALLAGETVVLQERLASRLEGLVALGADRLVMCCMTAHAFIPSLPDRVRERMVSLVDVLLQRIIASDRRHLLLCTNGSRHVRLYERSPLWAAASAVLVLPSDSDQEHIHRLIYELKRSAAGLHHLALVDALASKYGVHSVAAGCTEVHLLVRASRVAPVACLAAAIDPLTVVASEIAATALRAGATS